MINSTDVQNPHGSNYADDPTFPKPTEEESSQGEARLHKPTPPLPGYQYTTDSQVSLLKRIKDHGEMLRSLVAEVQRCATESKGLERKERLVYVDSGAMDLSTGLMKLTRAVANPKHF